MKRYLKNLWLALTGTDPYQAELDEMKDKYEKTAMNVDTLRRSGNRLYDLLERKGLDMDRLKQELDACRQRLEEGEKAASGLQQLVENLRDRIGEKDALIGQMKEEHWKSEVEYEKRIADYSCQVAKLQGELKVERKRPKRKQAKEKP